MPETRPTAGWEDAISDREFRSRYLSGLELFGDDFAQVEIDAWYDDEAEGYANLVASAPSPADGYEYGALNWCRGFSQVDLGAVRRVLAFGAFDGAELLPIARSGMEITIVEPSNHPSGLLPIEHRARVHWVEPSPTGDLDFPDGCFDLITCFGVLHHVPNVTHVLAELRRVLAPAGRLLIREPITSMGDWRAERPGLTKRERGIPLPLFRRELAAADLKIERESLCMFAPMGAIGRRLGRSMLTGRFTVALDALASSASRWNYQYHAESTWKKVRPGCVFYVLSVG